ncbi:MAG TPA: thioesterase family protein [Acidimicrobiales bacterium]|nr:thioesterase family protein [Acidimicrobiales bacterium]
MNFADATAVTSAGPGRYRAVVDESWQVQRGPNGGYLAALLLRALTAAVGDAARSPRSLTVHYLAPPDPGPVEVDVVVERSGRSVVSLSARMVQTDRLVALALAAFSSPWPGPELVEATMPAVPPYERTAAEEALDGPPFRAHFEQRPVMGAPPLSGADTSLSGGWIRLREDLPVDHLVVAALTDAWLPTIFSRLSVPADAPTIDLTIHFRSPPPLRPEPCLVVFRSWLATEGFFDEEGEVWSQDGSLLAQSRQLALVRSS